MDSKMKKAEVLVVDDHSLIVEGICRVVNAMPEAVVADATTSGKKALELIAKRDYDIYILDVSMPEVSGFDLIAQIRELNEDARIIVNTQHEEVWIVNRLAQSGVNAVTLKSSDSNELTNAIRSVLRGESYACGRFAALCQKLKRGTEGIFPRETLTRREREVLQALAKGLNSHEIAEQLHVSENTVETFRRRLMAKFGAKNAIDLVVKAIAQGWITLE
ncbi:response regulator transcription factor [uncultured Bacteroides sp.]|uniref:response regulator n=1 Tax=uncultured Bacteroides sp. TaxID=162156 RepID=UPI00261B86A2|nr:response regulator transcription factor [uncultured Bacteroides sp.]